MNVMSNCLKRVCTSEIGKLSLLPLSRMMSSSGCGGQGCGRKLKNFPCGQPEDSKRTPRKKVDKEVAKEVPTKTPSVWMNPFCDEDEPHCPFNPRFDDIFYVESDKAKRKYWQTWVSCPPPVIKPKKVCSYEVPEAAPLRRRKISSKPQTARAQTPRCVEEEEDDCPRLKRSCHRAGRIPPSCSKTWKQSTCKKPLTPYPAFSECVRQKPGALPLSECICWQKPMLCELWAEWRRRSMKKN